MGKKIEIFTADCPLCKETLEMLREEICDECELIECRCEGDECCQPALKYELKAIPTIVVDGKVTILGKPSREEIRKLFI
jgi:predicted thioredoxin/glutaredoxin